MSEPMGKRGAAAGGSIARRWAGAVMGLCVMLLGCDRPASGQALLLPAAPQHQDLPSQGPAADFELTNQDGRRVRLSQFRGRLVLMSFFYTECPDGDFCPTINLNLRQVHDTLDDVARAQLVLVSVTYDPQSDTPERLKQYAAQRGLSLPNWHFLTGAPGEVADLLREYGIDARAAEPRVHPHPDGTTHQHGREFSHLAQALLIDQQGEVRGAYLGVPLGEGRLLSVADLVQDITLLLPPAQRRGDGPWR